MRDVHFLQDFAGRLTARCKATVFATGNFTEHDMKDLATDVESLMTVCSILFSPVLRPVAV